MKTRISLVAAALILALPGAPIFAQQPPPDPLVIEQNTVKVSTISGMGTVPVGAIMMWSGDPNSLPDGWVLCDGASLPGGPKVPDLRGRFVAGYAQNDETYRSIGPSVHRQLKTTGSSMTFTASMTGRDAPPGDKVSLVTASGAVADTRPPYFVLAYIIYTGVSKTVAAPR